mmetsp:Transcript_21949/g.45129  ORF Transcript_21949/g.45129 Transcript_21949/m.45129 type:complete len:153 (+) Transcript_21949:92-550(+)
MISSKYALLLLAVMSKVTAFLPVSQQHLLPQRSTNTQLYESILDAEDRYLEQAGQANAVVEKPEVVFTVVYNPGTPEEGIHTAKYPRGSDSDVLLIFEGMADCITFARTITEDPSMNQTPIPTPTSLEMIEKACQGMGIQTAFVPMEQKTQW